MSSQTPWERALERYADALYRFALLRDPVPVRAALATAAAFEHLNWTILDDQIETHLIAALPPLSRGIGSRLRTTRRFPLALPLQFWRLPPATRLALSMRLMRGHTTESIAQALGLPLDNVRLMLCDAIARIADDDIVELDPTCRRSRSMRLDDPSLERTHVLGCEACRIALPRWDAAERRLADALMRTTGALRLPHETVEGIALSLRAATSPAASPTRNPLALRTASVVLVVLVAIGLLIMPRSREQTTAPVNVAARDVISQALARYGTVPDGDGVIHQRIQLMLDQPPWDSYQAEVWTNTERPARHRMQLMTGNTVLEWQGGDGVRSWRYFTQPDSRFCGLTGISFATTNSRIGRWQMESGEQAAMRAARWQTGPWAVGRHLMEQALAAPRVRSLGMVSEADTTILTLAAEGGPISGTLLLRLNAATAELREIRRITVNNGQTLSETRWKLLDQERLTSDAALRSAVFTTYPIQKASDALDRSGPVLDPACPIGGRENTASLASILGVGWPQLIGFSTLPDGLDRAYVAAPVHNSQHEGMRYYQPETTALVYVGPGKRLVLRPEPIYLQPGNIDRPVVEGAQVTGTWHVAIDTGEMKRFSGTILAQDAPSSAPPALMQVQLRWTFFAEGWTHDEIVALIGTMRILRLQDWVNHQSSYFDPDPIAPDVMAIIEPALQALAPRPDRIDHLVVERELRQEPGSAHLEDPYHALGLEVRTDTWLSFDTDGQWQNYRRAAFQLNGQPLAIQWGDRQQIQTYDVRANVVSDTPAILQGVSSMNWGLQEVLRPIFQYGNFKIVARDSTTTMIATTMPIGATEYEWASQVEQPPISYWQNWPTFAGTIPQSITFGLQFDRSSGLLREYTVTIPGPNGPILIDRMTIITAAIGTTAPGEGWDFQPPPDAVRISSVETKYDYPASRQQRIALTFLEGALGLAPAPLWGWPEGHPLRFTDAYVPAVVRFAPQSFESIEMAVTGGYAVEMHYARDRSDPVTLIQGSPAQLRLLLQQTPAAWTSSEQRTLPVAGRSRQVWIMNAEGRHWVIFQLDTTFIILDYRGEHFEDMVLPALADLRPLE